MAISVTPKLLFVCYDGFRTTNARVRCYRFSEQLRKNGIEAEVFSFKDHLKASHDGEDSYKVGFLERISLLFRATSRLMREDRRTVFYIQKAGYFAIAPLIAHLIKGNPLILDYDDYEYEQSWLSRPLLKILAKNSVFCVAASHYLQQLLLKFSKKVYLIPTGVDTEVFRPRRFPKASPQQRESSLSRGPVVFAWIGIIVDRAALDNVMMILDAFAELDKKGLDFRLEIVGGGQYMALAESRIRALGSKKIIFKGRLVPEEIPAYLDSVDVGLFVLASPTKYNLSKSPTKLFEYMAKGLAVISTPIGEAGFAVMTEKSGLIAITRGDIEESAQRLIIDRRLIADYGREAQSIASSQYSLGLLGQKLAEIIRENSGKLVR